MRQLESLGGFGGRADLLNYFNVFTGDPGRLNKDFDRYLTVTPADVQRMAQEYLNGGRVRLRDLAPGRGRRRRSRRSTARRSPVQGVRVPSSRRCRAASSWQAASSCSWSRSAKYRR